MAVGGLGTDDVRAIRDGVAAGRRPRVVFTESAGQIAGQLGQVVALTDPGESDDWLVVRFGKDELPFSPGDLAVAPRGAAARGASARGAAAKTGRPRPAAPVPRPEPEFVIDKPVGRSVPAARSSPAESSGAGSSKVGSSGPGAGDSGPGGSGAVAESDGSSGSVSGGSAGRGTPGRKAAARGGKAKGPAGLTVTLAYAEGEWTVSAHQGSRVLARPYEIRPSEALRMVALVDVPGVQEAVQQILSAERAEAQQRADKLRAELAEIEERLAELRDAG